MEVILYLTYLAVVLVIGLGCSIISKRLKIPNVLLLILVGIGFSLATYQGRPLISFPNVFVTAIGILALVMIVFDSSSRFKLKQFDNFSYKALALTGVFLGFNLIILTTASYWIFNIPVGVGILFAVLMTGTSPDVVFSIVSATKNKVTDFLKIEALINTPIIVLLPFIVLAFIQSVETSVLAMSLEQLKPFLLQIIAGIGAGVLMGLIAFKVMKTKYSDKFSPIALIAIALLTYVLAENMGGNGVLAVTTAGLFFGNVYVKHKQELQQFSSTFALFLEILLFVFIGLVIKIPFTGAFVLKAFALYLLFCLSRYLALHFVLKQAYTIKERIFMTFNAPKGIATVVVLLILAGYLFINGMQSIISFGFAFVLISIIVSTIMTRFSKILIKKETVR